MNTIRRYIFAWRYRRAVRKAKKLSQLFGMRYYVLNIGGSLRVIPKRQVKNMIRMRYFRKGPKIEDIERVALFVTV